MCAFLLQPFIVLLCLSLAVSAAAGEPTEQVKKTTDKILSILKDPALKDPSKSKTRQQLVWDAVDERFDWDELARRSMGPHWAKLTQDERKEFVGLFASLLRRIYLHRVDEYSGENVRYGRERVDGDYAELQVTILTKGKEVPTDYRLIRKGRDWRVYDVQIEGMSLVKNYRAQFNAVLSKSSTRELFKILREKVKEGT